MIHSAQEVKLYNGLSIFFSQFKMIGDRFTNDSLLQKEFENIGINSLNIWKFIASKLQQEWAKVFSFLCQKSNIDQKLIDQYVQSYKNKYLAPLLQINTKDVVRDALQIYQEI